MLEVDLTNGEDSVKWVVIDYERPELRKGYDANWLVCDIKIQARPFSANYRASLLTFDFHQFAESLSALLDRTTEEATFHCDEEWLNLRLSRRPTGAISVRGCSHDQRNAGARLDFGFQTDETFLLGLVSQLQALVNDFPQKPLG